MKAVESIDGIELITQPDMTALAIVASRSNVNILAVADAMERRGWKMERQQLPNYLHMSILPQHVAVVDKLIKDLRESSAEVVANPKLAKEGSTGMYGMVAAIPDKGIINDFSIGFLGKIYTPDSSNTLIK